jgi:hypothetical protein
MRARALLRWLAVALALAIATAWVPTAARGTDAIPDAQTGEPLPFGTVAAIVGDVDGDGVRELVRLVRMPGDPSLVGAEVVTMGANGQPVVHEAAQLLSLSGAGATLPADVTRPASLIAWRFAGEERVLALSGGGSDSDRGCCLGIWQVGLEADSRTSLRPIGDVADGARQVRVVDLDGDGTDEIVTYRARPSAVPSGYPLISILRWTGDRFRTLRATALIAAGGPLVPLGDSDGLPGDELALTSGSSVCRIALDAAGEVRLEYADLPFAGELVPFPGPDGNQLVLASDTNGATLLGWAADGPLEVVATSDRIGIPLATLGSGDEARVLLVRYGDVLDLLGPELRSYRSGLTADVAGTVFGRYGLPPYIGPIPGGLPDGEPAAVFQGRTITRVPTGSQPPRIGQGEIASMPGMTPIGFFGPGAGWGALAMPEALARPAYLDNARDGGELAEQPRSRPIVRLVVVESSALLSTEADLGRLRPSLDGAVRTGQPGVVETVLARGEFTASLTAPPVTRGLLSIYGGLSGFAVGPGPTSVVVRPLPGRGEDRMRVAILLVTGSGHGYHLAWDIRVVTQPPSLGASAPFAPLSFDVPVTGRTDPGAAVRIDGAAVQAGADGSFATTVPAGVVPRDVVLEATDPVGNRASRTLSVVGFVDYRRLPWIPIVAVLTIAGGAVLFLRAPRPTRAPARALGDDATLEEID